MQRPVKSAHQTPISASAAPNSSTAMVIARRRGFAMAHFYAQSQFSAEKNRDVFGACYSPHGHGHNYVLEAFVAGPINEQTRLVMDLALLDTMMIKAIEPLDHRHANFDVSYFQDVIPTTENIALYLRTRLLDELKAAPGTRLHRLRLFESEDLWVEVRE